MQSQCCKLERAASKRAAESRNSKRAADSKSKRAAESALCDFLDLHNAHLGMKHCKKEQNGLNSELKYCWDLI